MTRMAFLIVTAALGMGVGSAQAAEKQEGLKRQGFYLGIAAFAPNLARVSGDNAANTTFIDSIYPQLTGAWRAELSETWALSPTLSFTLVPGESGDQAASRRYLILSAPFARQFELWDVKAGMGLLYYLLSGRGGTVQQGNGTASSTFYLPSQGMASGNFFLDGGVGVQEGRFRFDFDFLMTGPLSSRRAISMMAQVSYGFL